MREGRAPSYGDPYYIGEESHGKTRTNVTSSQIRKDSDLSGSGTSEEYILQDLRGNDVRSERQGERSDLGGIQVSRSVHQRRD